MLTSALQNFYHINLGCNVFLSWFAMLAIFAVYYTHNTVGSATDRFIAMTFSNYRFVCCN